MKIKKCNSCNSKEIVRFGETESENVIYEYYHCNNCSKIIKIINGVLQNE